MSKKILGAVIALGAISSLAHAGTQICAGVAGPATAAVASATDGSKFVAVAFTPKCSQNVHLSYTDQVTNMAVGSVSIKGANSFYGNSSGGGVAVNGPCAATPCGDTDMNNALTVGESHSS